MFRLFGRERPKSTEHKCLFANIFLMVAEISDDNLACLKYFYTLSLEKDELLETPHIFECNTF